MLKNDAMLRDRLYKGASLDDRVAQGFFAVDVLSRLGRRNGRQDMPVVRCGDLDGVNVFSRQEFAEVVVAVFRG